MGKGKWRDNLLVNIVALAYKVYEKMRFTFIADTLYYLHVAVGDIFRHLRKRNVALCIPLVMKSCNLLPVFNGHIHLVQEA